MKTLYSLFRSGALFSVVFLVLSSITVADQVVTTLPAGGAKDLLESPHKLDSANQQVSGPADGAIKMKKDCTFSDGRVVAKAQPDYQRCLKEKLEKPKK